MSAIDFFKSFLPCRPRPSPFFLSFLRYKESLLKNVIVLMPISLVFPRDIFPFFSFLCLEVFYHNDTKAGDIKGTLDMVFSHVWWSFMAAAWEANETAGCVVILLRFPGVVE